MQQSLFPARSRLILVAVLSLPWSGLRAQTPVAAPPKLTLNVSGDRADALYQAGETATFTIDASEAGQSLKDGTVTCVFSQDGWNPQPAQTVSITDGKAKVSGKLDRPGFLLLKATTGKTTALAGAGYEPLKIPPSLPVPDDFDEFWAAQKAVLTKVPLNPKLTPVNAPAEGIEAFDVQVECVGKPVSGYFGRPKEAKPKSLPAILFVHGAGVRSASLGGTQWALREGGMLAFDINAHGIPNGQPAEFYEELNQGELKDYRAAGRQDRETCYFKGMFLRLIRAIDFLTAQPEWDGKTLIVYGSSQGGFQAFAAAGLDHRVSFICAGVPAGCDHTGNVVDRISGWPKLVPLTAERQPDPQVLGVARYFDCVNFATRAKCRGAAVTVGYIDTTCPPTSVYAAYNVLTIPKSIHADVDAGHTNTPAASQFMQDAAYRHVREMR
ncbi:MAG TPA: acetylxylan esterase [Planctomycetaceae bacterium]|nr:acetylxylan esterase [Planctomycetaceae bacterium]